MKGSRLKYLSTVHISHESKNSEICQICLSVQITLKNARKWTLFSNNTNGTIGISRRELSFSDRHTFKIFLTDEDSLLLVKFSFDIEMI